MLFKLKPFRREVYLSSLNFFRTNHILADSYTYEVAKQIEKKWSPKLEQIQKEYTVNNQILENFPKKYVLSMFPYPSGRLHLGHVRVYTTSDILARFYRMNGYYVIHPIGFDSFGLPAENAAIQRNISPEIWTANNIENMKSQLKSMSFSFDWNRELSTCDKSYYKWTQYLFLELFKHGIVYQKEALVNWDPVDKTVLANEQIDEEGKSWRSGAKAEKKILKQWFLKSSYYAKSLSESLKDLNSVDWDVVKKIQKMWIGKCDGYYVDYSIKLNESSNEEEYSLPVYTENLHGIYGVSHIVISKNNILLKRLNAYNENSFLNCYAINPLNPDQKIPIYLNSNDDFGELNLNGVPYLDARLSIPSLNENDKKFAIENNLIYRNILNGYSKLIDSNDATNLTKEEAIKLISNQLRSMSKGGHATSSKLNDWCISRQRKWGTPIPLIFCNDCKYVPIPYEQLPLELESIKKKTKCPKCNKEAVYEKDTMDTFVDSSWYYFRYLDVKNAHKPFDIDKINKKMPVDIYIGGVEHAMTHLFVSRLITHFLNDKNGLKFKEPFVRFLAMGMIKGESFKTKNGRYVPSDEVEERTGKYFIRDTNEELSKDFEKMSKSKLNGIDPEFMIEKYGIDFTRLFLVNFVHPKSDRNFALSSDMIDGNKKIFERLWKLTLKINQYLQNNKSISYSNNNDLARSNEITRLRNTQLSMIDYNLTENFNFPSYIVAISKILKHLTSVPEANYDENFFNLFTELLILASPIIPHFTSECWNIVKQRLPVTNFDKNKELVQLNWPKLDMKFKKVKKIKRN